MKKSNPYLLTILLAVFGLFVFSCGGPTGPIELNNGEKWKVNAEMMPPLNASQKLVSDFPSNNKKNYKALAEQLKENNKLLISSCTMNGKSHDELHKWLHPYMSLLDELENSEKENEANHVFEKIEKSFETFNQNFQ